VNPTRDHIKAISDRMISDIVRPIESASRRVVKLLVDSSTPPDRTRPIWPNSTKTLLAETTPLVVRSRKELDPVRQRAALVDDEQQIRPLPSPYDRVRA
jgi:hypothetical protein